MQVNIAEGYAFGPSARMGNHLRIAYASAVETAGLLELLEESDLSDPEAAADLVGRCRRCQKLLTGLLRRYGWIHYDKDKVDNPDGEQT